MKGVVEPWSEFLGTLSRLRDQVGRRLGLVAFLSISLALSTGFFPWHAVGLVVLTLCLRSRSGWVVWALAAGLGIWLRPTPVQIDFDKKPFYGVVQVVSIPSDSELGATVTVSKAGRRYRLFLPADSGLNLGDVVELGGEQTPPNESRLGSRGVVAVVRPIGGIRWLWRGPSVFGWGAGIRRSFLTFTAGSLSQRSAATVDALCMGADYALDDDQWDAFKRTGTVHVVVASGLQTLIVTATALSLLSRLSWRREFKLLLVFAALFLYCAVAGFRPPVLRAALMAVTSYGAYLFGRQSDGLNSLGIAAAVAVGLDPWQVYDLGLWLSFSAVGGLIVGSGFDGTFRGEGPWWKRALQTNIVATAATAPVTAWALGQVSLIGLLANLFVVPAMEGILLSSMLAWLISLVLPAAGALFVQSLVSPVVERLQWSVDLLARLPFAVAPFGPFSAYWLVPIYLGLILMWKPRRLLAD